MPHLAQAGLRRIGDLILRPRAPLAARFGTALFNRLDALLGHAKTPITPRFEAPAYLAERRFAEPIVQRETIRSDDPRARAANFRICSRGRAKARASST